MTDSRRKPNEHWFHIDDARTAEECEGRDEAWQPFVEAEAYADALALIEKLATQYLSGEWIRSPDLQREADKLKKSVADFKAKWKVDG